MNDDDMVEGPSWSDYGLGRPGKVDAAGMLHSAEAIYFYQNQDRMFFEAGTVLTINDSLNFTILSTGHYNVRARITAIDGKKYEI